jgi:hypothetical protein
MLDAMLGEAGLNEFPYVDTTFMNYTPDLVTLLSNHAAWMLVSNEALVREMLGEKAVDPAAAVAATSAASATVAATTAAAALAAAEAVAAPVVEPVPA